MASKRLDESTRTRATLASLTFFQKTTDGSERAFWRKGPIDTDQETPRTNISYHVVSDIPIYDLRTKLHHLSLDNHGFQLVHYPSACIGLQDESATNKLYMEEAARLVKTITNAEHVICYDLRYRENASAAIRQELNVGDAGSRQTPDSPAWQVHVDQTKNGGYLHVCRYLSDKQIQLYLRNKDWRVRVVNAWRPVSWTVGDAPIAFCDYHTIDKEDLVPTDRPWKGLAREIYNIKWNSSQRWYWIRDQTPDEVTLFLNWDSSPIDGGPEFCAHASFLDPKANPDLPPRRSIEVRTLVITKRH